MRVSETTETTEAQSPRLARTSPSVAAAFGFVLALAGTAALLGIFAVADWPAEVGDLDQGLQVAYWIFAVVQLLGTIVLVRSIWAAWKWRHRSLTHLAVSVGATVVAATIGLFVIFVLPQVLGDTEVGTLDIQYAIEDELDARVAEVDDQVTSQVECPTRVVMERGEEFDCIATFSDDTSLTVTVRWQNDDGEYIFSWE